MEERDLHHWHCHYLELCWEEAVVGVEVNHKLLHVKTLLGSHIVDQHLHQQRPRQLRNQMIELTVLELALGRTYLLHALVRFDKIK